MNISWYFYDPLKCQDYSLGGMSYPRRLDFSNILFISWGIKNQLNVTCYFLFHLLFAQHVSDINMSIFRSLWLCWMDYHIGYLVLFSLCVGVCCFNLQNGHHQTSSTANPNTQRKENKITNVVIHSTQSQAPEDGHINVRNMLSK